MGVASAIRTIEDFIASARASQQSTRPQPAVENGPVPKAADEEQLWTAREVARFLNVSLSWVRHRSAEGKLPSVRIGALVRYDPGVIKAYGRAGPARVHGKLSR